MSNLNQKSVMIIAAKANMIQQFNLRNIKMLQEMGYEVHVGSNFQSFGSMSEVENERMMQNLKYNGVVLHQIDFGRGMGSFKGNSVALKQLNRVFDEEQFSFIHVHSPLGSILGRIAAFKNRIPVVYTAHGFHFFKGGPVKSWILFYPLEFVFAFITNAVVTINNADEQIAKQMPYRKVFRIWSNGSKVREALKRKDKDNIREKKRKELGIGMSQYTILSVGELNHNKNHEIVIRALAPLAAEGFDFKYLIAGVGKESEHLKHLADSLGLATRVRLLGYRTDVHELNLSCDLFVFPSLREGLGISGLDAVVDGTYILGSNVGGIKDYVVNENIGKLFSPTDVLKLTTLIRNEIVNPRKVVGEDDFLMKFDESNVDITMAKVYGYMRSLGKED